MAPVTVTWETLRELASFRAEKGCAISVCLDLDPSTAPTPADVETRFNSLLSQAEKDAESGQYDHARKQALSSDLDRIRAWWDAEFDRSGSRGVAVYASSLDGLWRTLPLPDTVSDEVRIERELLVAPLVPLVGRGDGALVAFVGRERGQVFRLREGRLEEVVDQSEEQPGQHGQGGWSQARYERHIEKLVQDHFKTVGSEIDRRLRRGAATMVVVGPTELRSEFEAALSAEAREAIVGWATAEAHATPTELLDVALPLLERARAEAAAATVERWRAEAGRNGRATAGWTHTLEAASDGRVEVLLVQEGASHDGYRCPECGRGAAAPGACPLDGNALEHVDDGLDLALHRVLAFGGAVVSVNGNSLADQEGIGALLRY